MEGAARAPHPGPACVAHPGPQSQARGLGRLLASLRPPPVREGQAEVWPSMVVPGRRPRLGVPVGQGVGYCGTAACRPALRGCELRRGRSGCESGLWGDSDSWAVSSSGHLSPQGVCPWRGHWGRAVAGCDDGSSWQPRALQQARSQDWAGVAGRCGKDVGECGGMDWWWLGLGDGWGVAGGMGWASQLSSWGQPCNPGAILGLRDPCRRARDWAQGGRAESGWLVGAGVRADVGAVAPAPYTTAYTAEAPGPPRDEMGPPGTPPPRL